MNDLALGIVAALPWLATPVVAAARGRRVVTLDVESGSAPADAPPLTVVIPARDEAHNIEACLRSVLTSTYPRLEVVVVNDHSADGTGDIARRVALPDGRVRVVENPDLPPGWMGKQWACATGAREGRGELLCFVDADTRHTPELLTRAVNGMRRRGAALLSVVGTQEARSFWERVMQPLIFALIGLRFGGTEQVERSRRVRDKIVNGQFILTRRDVYESLGGHASVRDLVGEDLALAQRYFAHGHEIALSAAPAMLSTRMYTSLGEIVGGWRKNVFAAGRHAMPGGRMSGVIAAVLLLLTPILALLPPVALAWSLAAGGPAWMQIGSALALGAQLVFLLGLYHLMRVPLPYALLFPLGAVVLMYIGATAVARGSRVAWKGREYRAA